MCVHDWSTVFLDPPDVIAQQHNPGVWHIAQLFSVLCWMALLGGFVQSAVKFTSQSSEKWHNKSHAEARQSS